MRLISNLQKNALKLRHFRSVRILIKFTETSAFPMLLLLLLFLLIILLLLTCLFYRFTPIQFSFVTKLRIHSIYPVSSAENVFAMFRIILIANESNYEIFLFSI